MNRIADAFNGKKAFVSYLMAGDPSIEKSAEYILALQEAGADLIEVGIPFSDPIAEGEVIQAASVRALKAGATLDKVFTMLEGIREKVHVPLVFMTYANPVYHRGYEVFFRRCAEVGVCGIIIPDMPFEEQGEAKDIAAAHGVELVTLVAPTSEARVQDIAREASGFIYLVSSMGVTGVRSEITTDVAGIVARIKAETDTPVAVGFGIATPQQAATYAKVADGAIVGSAIVRIIAQHGENAAGPLKEYVAEMKAATEV